MNGKKSLSQTGTSGHWMQRMFDSASGRYVLVNRILTLGKDEAWRQAAVEIISPVEDGRILDVCTGTGDLAIKIARNFPGTTVYALDFSQAMLAAARERVRKLESDNLVFKAGNCTALEFPDGYFDYVTVSFGFRNLSYSLDNLQAALKEIYRVLKKGGRFIILETSQPGNALVRRLFHIYARRIVPAVGRLFSGRKSPYSYLGGSIVKFFDRGSLLRILKSAGFGEHKSVSFAFGAIFLCVMQK